MKTHSTVEGSGRWERIGDPVTLLRYQGYEVDLEDMDSSAAVLDWIVQVSKKSWADRALVGELVESIDEILALQATYCSNGIEQRVPPSR